MIGKGSQYPWSGQDSKGNPLDGAKNYKLHLPPNILSRTSGLSSHTTTRHVRWCRLMNRLQVSVVKTNWRPMMVRRMLLWPQSPPGLEHNSIQTIPGKGWFMILRLYGPLEPWFNKTWRPGEIELQE